MLCCSPPSLGTMYVERLCSWTVSRNVSVSSSQLPTLGLRFAMFSGLFLVGGAYVLLGCVQLMPLLLAQYRSLLFSFVVFFVCSFVYLLSPGLEFITFCVVLRLVQGTGSALFSTATFTLLPELFPNALGTITVRTATSFVALIPCDSLCFQGLFEMGGGLGFSIGPPIGGLLYKVRQPVLNVVFTILNCTVWWIQDSVYFSW